MLKEISLIGAVYNSIRFLTAASLSVTRVKKGSKLRISTTRWGQRSKVALKTPLEISGFFWCNKTFDNEILTSDKSEIDRK